MKNGFAYAGEVDGRAVYSRTEDGALDTERAAERLAWAILRKYGGADGLRKHGLALRETKGLRALEGGGPE